MTEKPRTGPDRQPRMTLADMEAFFAAEFPQATRESAGYTIEAIGYGEARLRLAFQERNLRPGGTLSGASIMALADVALYAALLGAIGPVALAVTTNFSINFLRKPEPRDLVARCRYLKIGRSLAIGQVELVQDGSDDPLAHVVATFSIPPKG